MSNNIAQHIYKILNCRGIPLFEHRSKDTVSQSCQKTAILPLLIPITIGVVFALSKEIEASVHLSNQLLHPLGLFWPHLLLWGSLAKQCPQSFLCIGEILNMEIFENI